ncbi:hypothetical protein GQ457_05G019660 [Hibiscus cannabinus]
MRTHLTSNSLCPVCGQDDESLDHVFRFCGRAHQIWSKLIRHDRLHYFNALHFEDWLTHNLKSPTMDFLSEKFRDKIVRAGSPVAGSCRRTGSLAYSSGVIHNSVGEWLFDYSRSMGSYSILVVELWVALDVLRHAWRLEFRKVELEVGNVADFQIMVGTSNVLHDTVLVVRICEILSNQWDIFIMHVLCEANFVTDGLVKMAKGKPLGEWVYGSFPWRSNHWLVRMHVKAHLLAIAIYGLVIFPRVLGYIDVALFDVFDQFRYGINPAPAILAETFISLNACRELEGGRFRGCAQLLYVWIRSHFWKTPKPVLPGIRSMYFSPLREFLATEWEEVDPTKWVEAFRNLQEHDLVWRTPWLLTIEYLYRCYNYHWLMLLGLWGAIGCAPLLVSRQFGSLQLNQSRAQHIQLEARVREQEDIIREYQTRDEYTELQASQSKVEALEKEVKDLWAMVQTCQISVQVLEDAKEGGDDYWFTRLRHAAHRFQEQDKTNEKIMNLAQDVAEHVTTIARKARIMRPHAISREMKSELELLFNQIEDLGVRVKPYLPRE